MEQTRIWAHFQNDELAADATFNARLRYEFIAGHVGARDKTLNIGVGRGGLESILSARGVDISCLDPDERSIGRIREGLGLGERALTGFSQSLPFSSNAFDVIIMSEVLEHLDDEILHATLDEVRRVLKPGGRFLGTVPADEDLLVNQVVCPHCGELFHRWGHVRSFTREKLIETLSTRFSDVRLSRHFFGDPQRMNWKGRLGRAAKRTLMSFGVHGRDETFFFTASRTA